MPDPFRKTKRVTLAVTEEEAEDVRLVADILGTDYKAPLFIKQGCRMGGAGSGIKLLLLLHPGHHLL